MSGEHAGEVELELVVVPDDLRKRLVRALEATGWELDEDVDDPWIDDLTTEVAEIRREAEADALALAAGVLRGEVRSLATACARYGVRGHLPEGGTPLELLRETGRRLTKAATDLDPTEYDRSPKPTSDASLARERARGRIR